MPVLLILLRKEVVYDEVFDDDTAKIIEQYYSSKSQSNVCREVADQSHQGNFKICLTTTESLIVGFVISAEEKMNVLKFSSKYPKSVERARETLWRVQPILSNYVTQPQDYKFDWNPATVAKKIIEGIRTGEGVFNATIVGVCKI